MRTSGIETYLKKCCGDGPVDAVVLIVPQHNEKKRAISGGIGSKQNYSEACQIWREYWCRRALRFSGVLASIGWTASHEVAMPQAEAHEWMTKYA